MDGYISHLPGKIPCIAYNGSESNITAFPDADGGNMGHIVCDLLLVKDGISKTIRYLEAIDKYRYVKNILDNNILLKPTSGYSANISDYHIGEECPNDEDSFETNPYYTEGSQGFKGGVYLTECDNIDPYSCLTLVDTNVYKVDEKYYKSDSISNRNSNYILVSEEEFDKLLSISVWWEEYINFVGGNQNFIEYFKDYDAYKNHCKSSAVTDYNAYDSYTGCFKFCIDFEKLFLGRYQTPKHIYNLCDEDVPSDVYMILAAQYKKDYKNVQNFSEFENFIDKISDKAKGAIPVPVNEGITVKNDFWKESAEDYEDGAYFVAPYIEMPLCLESNFVDEGLYSLYENTTEESQYLFIGSGQTNSGNCNPNSISWKNSSFGLNDGNGIDVVSPIFDVVNNDLEAKSNMVTFKFEDEGIEGLLSRNIDDIVYFCSTSNGSYEVLVGDIWKCRKCNDDDVVPNNSIKEVLFLGDIPYRNDFSSGTSYYVKPTYLNGCKTRPTFRPNHSREGLYGLDGDQVILPVFCNLSGASWSALTNNGTTEENETEVKYKMFDNGQPIGVLKEVIKWKTEKIHTSVFGQETDLWAAKYEFETIKDDDGNDIHMAKLLAYEYQTTSGVTENEYFFDPALNGLMEAPKVDIDVSIDRGSGAAWEKHFKLMECNTLEDLENYGNNYFNIRDL